MNKMKILEPQYGDHFIGRDEEIIDLKNKIGSNGIMVLVGNRGVGKTNLMHVIVKDLKKGGKDCRILDGSLFNKQIEEIFKPSILSRISGLTILSGGISFNPKEPFILESLEKSDEKIIFVENAQKLNEEALGLIFVATNRNNRLRFVLEIATPYMKEIKLKGGSYKIFELKELDSESTLALIKNFNPDLSNKVMEYIVIISKCYPYFARVISYICSNQNTEEDIFKFFTTLKDDEKYNLDKIHEEILISLEKDSQNFIKKLALAPSILPMKLIMAFYDKEDIDTALSDTIDRGLLRSEGKFYLIYHPLFRDYLISIQPATFDNKKERYSRAMEKVKSDIESMYILFDVLNEPDIFNELIEISENIEGINLIGIQNYLWGEIESAFNVWSTILSKVKESNKFDKKWESITLGNIGCVYFIIGEPDKAQEFLERALKLDKDLEYKEGIANHFTNIGSTYFLRGELDNALNYFKASLELFEEQGRNEEIAKIYGNIGNVHLLREELDKAQEYFNEALKFFKEQGNKEEIAVQIANIGSFHQKKGELNEALDYFKEALKLFEEQGIKQGIALQYGNIGNVYQIKGEFNVGLDNYKKALKLFEELRCKNGIATQFKNIGIAYKIKGELDKVLEFNVKALKLFEELKNENEMAIAYENIGLIYKYKEKLDKALDFYNKSLNLFKDLENKEGMARNYGNIGNAYQIREELDKALDYYNNSIDLYMELGCKNGIAIVYGNIGLVFQKKEELDKAIEFYKKSFKLYKELGDKEGMNIQLNNMGIVNFLKKSFLFYK